MMAYPGQRNLADVYHPSYPLRVQKMALGAVTLLGRLIGHDTDLQRYSLSRADRDTTNLGRDSVA